MHRATIAALLLFATSPCAWADNWPAWRGPHGNGVCDESDLPLAWSATENVAWRVPLPAPGNSTPIVWGDRVFVTGPQEEGRRRTVMCFDRADGTLRWTREIVFEAQEPTHATNPYGGATWGSFTTSGAMPPVQ
jgi:outer membrane protein assembly factor BamB